jgi:hypothetical protein
MTGLKAKSWMQRREDMENVGGQKWPQISRDVDSLQFACGCMSLWAPSIKPLFP